uniref:Uncharacterized protein n=1 Tax=Heterorhabditis bacteriophora TaxID=37862 RepID=A0A1I7WCV2_HETBA
MVLMVVTRIEGYLCKEPRHFPTRISVEEVHVQRYGTGRLGDCLDENEQRGLPGCLTTSPSPVFPTVSSRNTKTWLEDNNVDTMDWPLSS